MFAGNPACTADWNRLHNHRNFSILCKDTVARLFRLGGLCQIVEEPGSEEAGYSIFQYQNWVVQSFLECGVDDVDERAAVEGAVTPDRIKVRERLRGYSFFE